MHAWRPCFRALDEAGCCVGNRQAGNGSKPAFEHIKLVHSMAGAAVFIYLTDCLVRGEAHGISQIIAAGPAGFQRPKGVPPALPHWAISLLICLQAALPDAARQPRSKLFAYIAANTHLASFG